jgi:hypothetical protein
VFSTPYQYTNSGEGCKHKLRNKPLKNNNIKEFPATYAVFPLNKGNGLRVIDREGWMRIW